MIQQKCSLIFLRQQRVVSLPETRHQSHRKSPKKGHQNGS